MKNENKEMSEREIQKIKEEIQKSGFPLEIEVSNKLKEDDWDVIIHDYYLDVNEEKSREIDIHAYKICNIISPDYDQLDFSLIIECKKSSEPWVFYTSEFKKPQTLLKKLGKPRIHNSYEFREELREESHYYSSEFKKIATIGYEPFTKGKGQRIFEASMQVIMALAYKMKESEHWNKILMTEPPEPLHQLVIKYPIIVFDGHLFEYTSNEEIKPVMFLQYLVRHMFTNSQMNNLVGNTFLIDVMRKEFLPEYLRILGEELDAIKQKLTSWTQCPNCSTFVRFNQDRCPYCHRSLKER